MWKKRTTSSTTGSLTSRVPCVLPPANRYRLVIAVRQRLQNGRSLVSGRTWSILVAVRPDRRLTDRGPSGRVLPSLRALGAAPCVALAAAFCATPPPRAAAPLLDRTKIETRGAQPGVVRCPQHPPRRGLRGDKRQSTRNQQGNDRVQSARPSHGRQPCDWPRGELVRPNRGAQTSDPLSNGLCVHGGGYGGQEAISSAHNTSASSVETRSPLPAG
jgi:hypothetical protein